jgi:hypothetical protein
MRVLAEGAVLLGTARVGDLSFRRLWLLKLAKGSRERCCWTLLGDTNFFSSFRNDQIVFDSKISWILSGKLRAKFIPVPCRQ